MSRESVEVVRRMIDAWNDGDLGLAYMHPDVEMHQYSTIIDTAGVFRGHAGVQASARELFASFSDIQWDPRDFIVAPDGRVVVPLDIRAVGRASSAPVRAFAVHVWTVRDGMAVHYTAYDGLDEALEAVGLRE